jgi:2-octaprenylphenol hydroxylase
MSRVDCDILVVGAGMVGAAFAAALQRSPFSVSVLDAGPPPGALPADRYDLRVSAISPGTRDILRAAGAWERLDHGRVGPYESMRVWDAGSRGAIGFDAAELGEPWLGFIIENLNIQHALLGAIESSPNIQCRFGTAGRSLDIDADRCRLVLENGETLSASLVVGADGARSWVRDELGISVDKRLYGERAFVCEVATERPHDRTARQRFLATGPVAFLPLANGHCSVVWTCDAELAEELAGLEAADFGARLETALEGKLGRVDVVGPVGSFDLSRRRAAHYAVERAALIGDAAHVVHPLAGQGANLGFGDAWSLARVLRDAADRGRDIGGRPVLRRYERWRRGENFTMMRMLDALHALFSAESAPVRGIRGLGLDLVDGRRWLKHFLARQALGNTPGNVEIPPDARGRDV